MRVIRSEENSTLREWWMFSCLMICQYFSIRFNQNWHQFTLYDVDVCTISLEPWVLPLSARTSQRHFRFNLFSLCSLKWFDYTTCTVKFLIQTIYRSHFRTPTNHWTDWFASLRHRNRKWHRLYQLLDSQIHGHSGLWINLRRWVDTTSDSASTAARVWNIHACHLRGWRSAMLRFSNDWIVWHQRLRSSESEQRFIILASRRGLYDQPWLVNLLRLQQCNHRERRHIVDDLLF